MNAITVDLSPKAVWTGRILSGLALAFLALDLAIKLLRLPPAVAGTTQLGYPSSAVFVLGLIQLGCFAAYLMPRTAVLGAVLWTGYLGGAVATHFRLGNPLATHTLFPIYVAAM